MMDFAAARRRMVDGQVRPADVTNLDLIAAMLDLPRERFLPESKAAFAYLDLDVPLTDRPADSARRLLKPMVLAKLIQAADVKPNDRVLDVGCATGYSSAVLAHLAGSVVSLEEDPALARLATDNLAELGFRNVTVARGALTEGWPSAAPYDLILLNGATEIVPDALGHQLREGGRLVCVLGRSAGAKATLYFRDNGLLSGRPIFDAAAPLLPGFAKPLTFAF
jgi:protein-L-isoaspartate(D-aspartate) O-methyltransferase